MRAELRTEKFMEDAMNAWGAMVYRLALNQTHASYDADDVVQDVFLSLLKDSTQFTDGEHLKAWLIRVTLNRCHAFHRSSWRRRVDATDSTSTVFDGLEEPSQELFGSEVWEAIARLPANMRLVVHLHYFEGYPLDEIARLTECKPATARTRLHRARKRLKLDLEQEVERHASEYERLPLPHE